MMKNEMKIRDILKSAGLEDRYEELRTLFEEQKPEMNVAVIVHGGLVSSVYANGPVSAEVLDLDWPDFSTDEDTKELTEKERRADEIKEDPAYSAVW